MFALAHSNSPTERSRACVFRKEINALYMGILSILIEQMNLWMNWHCFYELKERKDE
jgi:hypothetical protein|uniref:Uncharacterized protein n=1 Tax=Siphoviridae sp. ctrCN24 TaxID=2827953 RepID=A0A8S5SKC6_9CAUD|nr:MAG TPA: hypothetical protein [Siphoviridae sp. ctrCN24]